MKEIKTAWDFSKLYSNINDSKIEKDIKAIDTAYSGFAKKYQDLKFLKSSKSLLAALDDYELLSQKTSTKPLWYLGLQQTIDNANVDIQAKLNRLSTEYLKSYKKVLFFGLALSKISEKDQQKFLKDKSLKNYHYFLEVLFKEGKHTLSEKEEKILTDKSQVAQSAWEDMMEKHISIQNIKFKGKEISLSEALTIKSDLPRPDRRKMHALIMAKLKEISFVAEAELNAVIKNKMIDDELRGFSKPYESKILGYQNDMKSIENLVDLVTKNNPLSHRFFKLKSKIINHIDKSSDTRITMAEMATGLKMAKTKNNISFEKGCELVKKSFAEADPEFADIFQSYLENGQIDAFPRLGKRSGAFCSPMTGVPTYVMLNYGNKLNDVSTIAHEMGHAIHSDLAKTQNAIYEDYTISVAEVASTFFENILLDNLMNVASPEEKRDLLVNKIQDRVFTIFAQIAYFQFEKKIHAAVREKGFVSKEEFAALFAECRRSYGGEALEVVEDDGYSYVYIGHFRSFFYVYTYAYGQLIADALYEEYKKDHSFIEKVKTFLKAGGSMSPENIFKSIGIDTAKPDFFKKGLQKIEKDLVEAEKLYADL